MRERKRGREGGKEGGGVYYRLNTGGGNINRSPENHRTSSTHLGLSFGPRFLRDHTRHDHLARQGQGHGRSALALALALVLLRWR